MEADLTTWQWQDILERHPARTVDTAWGRVTCRVAGSGPDMALLHGIGSGSGSWAYQFDAFAGQFRVIAWDAPGYGGSDDVSDPAIENYVAALSALFDTLDIRRCVLVGHSLGALIAARFARQSPGRVRGLFLADPAGGHASLDDAIQTSKREARLSRFEALGADAHAAERAPRLLREAATPEHVALVEDNMKRLRLSGYAAAARLLSDGDLAADVAEIRLPATVVCGQEDAITPPGGARRIAAAFPSGARYLDIADAGHASYVDAPAAFNDALRGFVGELS